MFKNVNETSQKLIFEVTKSVFKTITQSRKQKLFTQKRRAAYQR